jgi:stress response protein SCP2
MDIHRGQRVSLTEIVKQTDDATQSLEIGLCVSGIQTSVDFACFGLDVQQKLSDERYMTFYNQPESPCSGVKLLAAEQDTARFLCKLAALPSSIDRLVFTAALNDTQIMRNMQSGYLRFIIGNQEVAQFAFAGTDFQDEKALMLGEIYRKDNGWRFSATGQGFNGGLAALVNHFGGNVAEDTAPITPKLSLEKKIAAVAPKLVELAKKATISLEKHKLSTTVARVGLVLDASGSMYAQYDKGKVQQVIERLLPLAVHFDDDNALDVWAFSNKTLALPSATLQNYADYIASAEYGWRNWGMMSINNEPAVIEQVIQHYQHTKLPVFVIFISDGGVSQNAAIKKLLVDAARLPIFWQFVGIGGRGYGVLEKLDTLSGRVVDNCGFFSLDDINSVSEQVLYERLLSEFPLWLEAAKLKGIVR